MAQGCSRSRHQGGLTMTLTRRDFILATGALACTATLPAGAQTSSPHRGEGNSVIPVESEATLDGLVAEFGAQPVDGMLGLGAGGGPFVEALVAGRGIDLDQM